MNEKLIFAGYVIGLSSILFCVRRKSHAFDDCAFVMWSFTRILDLEKKIKCLEKDVDLLKQKIDPCAK
jgi:hypothetical protein